MADFSLPPNLALTIPRFNHCVATFQRRRAELNEAALVCFVERSEDARETVARLRYSVQHPCDLALALGEHIERQSGSPCDQYRKFIAFVDNDVKLRNIDVWLASGETDMIIKAAYYYDTAKPGARVVRRGKRK